MSKTYWMNDGVGINESKMNIIYNAEKAFQHKQEMDDAIATYEAKIQKDEKRDTITRICLVVFGGILLIATNMAGWAIAVVFSVCILIEIPTVFTSCLTDIYKPSEKYTPDIEYYLASEGKKILSITVEPAFDWLPSVQIIAENADHSTTETKIDFRVVERTDLQDIVLDVNEGVVYVPHERENGKRC